MDVVSELSENKNSIFADSVRMAGRAVRLMLRKNVLRHVQDGFVNGGQD